MPTTSKHAERAYYYRGGMSYAWSQCISVAFMVAVIPTIVILGPLAILAALLPFLFGGLALFLRRWLVLLTTFSVQSTIGLIFLWSRGGRASSSPIAMGMVWWLMALVAMTSLVWARSRERSLDNAVSVAPANSRAERRALESLSVFGLIVLAVCLLRGVSITSPWFPILPATAAIWAGTIASALTPAGKYPDSGKKRRLEPETIALWTLGLVCAGMGAAARPAPSPESAQVVWAFEPGRPGALISSPLVAGGRVYAGLIEDHGLSSGGVVYSLLQETGEVVWKFDDGGAMQHMYSSPCLADGRLYIGEGMHANPVCNLYCLDANSGHLLWRFKTAGHIESSPCVADGLVYFGAGDDGVYCLDAVTGTERWHFSAKLHIDTGPAVAEGRLYAGSGNSLACPKTEVFCLDAKTGAPIWEKPTDLPVWGSPAASGNQVFFGLGNGRLDKSAEPPRRPAGALLCVNAGSGKVEWRTPVADAVLARPTVDGDLVYFGARDGVCYCLSRHDGGIRWKTDLVSPVVTQVAVSSERVYVSASAGRVYGLRSESGERVWLFDLASYTQSQPRLFSSPFALVERINGEEHYRIFVGAELSNSVTSVAGLYCLEDKTR